MNTSDDSKTEKQIGLKDFKFNPSKNPFINRFELKTKNKRIPSRFSTNLIDPKNGEAKYYSTIYELKKIDDANFVKVFMSGIAAAYNLGRAAYRVFQVILQEYERAPMSGGYSETVVLAWVNGGLLGRNIGMSQKTFKRGLVELLNSGFIARRSNDTFWINPALFFKGDRVKFVNEYYRDSSRS